jgi:hypothetical protein
MDKERVLQLCRCPLYNFDMDPKHDIEAVEGETALSDRAAERDRVKYWMSCPPEERIAELERLRDERYGWTPKTRPRVAKVYRVVKFADAAPDDF